MATDAASDRWYKGNAFWDFENGRPQVSRSQQNAEQFATMIWKGTNIPDGQAQDVGFGIHCGYVLAWYCPSRPEDPTIKTTLENVCRDDGSCTDSEYLCNKDGYDECYNQMATKAHNKLRADHCAHPMTTDTTMAKALQRMIDNSQNPTDPLKRPAPYQNCYENFYQANWPITNEEIRDTNLATQAWYKHHDKYDFEKGEAKNYQRFVADSFTAIVWNVLDAKVAFARRQSLIVAWYCPGPSAEGAKDGINTPRINFTGVS
jgi:hypothetical protein